MKSHNLRDIDFWNLRDINFWKLFGLTRLHDREIEKLFLIICSTFPITLQNIDRLLPDHPD